jgi:hypothetical protein
MTGSANVVEYPTPNIHTVTGGGAYCSGGAGVTIGLTNSQSGINYQLYNGSSTVGTLHAGTGSALSMGYATAAGTYTVLGINASTACTATMTGTATVTVNPLPTISSSTFFLAPATTLTLSGSPTGGIWTSSLPGVAAIGSSSGVVSGVSIGTTVVGYTAAGCSTSHYVYVTATGHKSLPGTAVIAEDVTVIPNPNHGVFTVRGTIGLPSEDQVSLQITNMLGQTIYTATAIKKDSELNEQITLGSNISNGIYLLRVSCGESQKFFHIVIEQ